MTTNKKPRPLFLFLFALAACADQPFEAEDVTPPLEARCPDLVECPGLHVEDVAIEALDEVGAQRYLESQGYFVAKVLEVLDRPAGFPEVDEFPLEPHEWSEEDGSVAQEACEVITKRELEAKSAPDDWYRPIYAYCRWRLMNSSRAWQLGKQVKSKVDGSPIHDRDRSSGRYFYSIAVKAGRMNPTMCPHHRLPPLHVEHPSECGELARGYFERFKVELDPEDKARWLSGSHAFEAFGARGPVDWNAYHGYKAIGGCYPFAAFDRTDVAVTAVVRRSIKICVKYGCDDVNTTKYIRPHWNESI